MRDTLLWSKFNFFSIEEKNAVLHNDTIVWINVWFRFLQTYHVFKVVTWYSSQGSQIHITVKIFENKESVSDWSFVVITTHTYSLHTLSQYNINNNMLDIKT